MSKKLYITRRITYHKKKLIGAFFMLAVRIAFLTKPKHARLNLQFGKAISLLRDGILGRISVFDSQYQMVKSLRLR